MRRARKNAASFLKVVIKLRRFFSKVEMRNALPGTKKISSSLARRSLSEGGLKRRTPWLALFLAFALALPCTDVFAQQQPPPQQQQQPPPQQQIPPPPAPDAFGGSIVNPTINGNANGIFDEDGNSGSDWIKMFRGNGGASWIADPSASGSISAALRVALGLYSNALLIVASIILLYHLLIMVTETAHQGVVGGKRANQIWAPIRLVIAIGLLVPLASGLNSAQYITLQAIEWGSNMATKVWDTFLHHAGQGSGTDPTPHMPDTTSLAREAAKIGACMALVNDSNQKNGGKAEGQVTLRVMGPAFLYGTPKFQTLCGSIIVFALGPGAMIGLAELQGIIDQMQQYAPYFSSGNQQSNQDPGPAPDMMLSAVIGTLESVSGGWNNAGGSVGSGWISAGSWFLTLAAGGSNRVSGTDTLPIVMGPQSEKIRPETVQQSFFKMAEWIVGKYKRHISGGGADPDMIGNTVAGRKFVDLMLLFLDQMGVVSGLWAPGSIAFYINLGNSPLAELVDLGHRMIRTALDFVGAAVELGVNEPQHAMYSAQAGASAGSKSFGPKSGIFFATMALPILGAAASALLSMGMLLGIFMPLLPFSKFVLSVMTWLISVLETMACVPLLALAWLTPYGEGFGGQKVEPGYYLVIHTFLRPVMTIFGLVASILIFNVAAYLVTTFYYAIASNAGTFSGGMYVVTKIAFGMMYISILYLCLNASLKVMDTFGRNAVTWMGGKAHEEQLGDAQAAVSTAQQGTAMLTQGLHSMAQSSLSAGMQLAGGQGGQGQSRALDPSQEHNPGAPRTPLAPPPNSGVGLAPPSSAPSPPPGGGAPGGGAPTTTGGAPSSNPDQAFSANAAHIAGMAGEGFTPSSYTTSSGLTTRLDSLSTRVDGLGDALASLRPGGGGGRPPTG
jgi:hypothetical protein